jgi:hypothetical protein
VLLRTITTMATLFDRVVREVSQSVIVEPCHELACQFHLLYDKTQFESIGLDLAVVLLNETHASGYLGQQQNIAMPYLNPIIEHPILQETSHINVKAIPVRTPIL